MHLALHALSLLAPLLLVSAVGTGLIRAALQDGRDQRAHAIGPRPGID